MEKLEYQAERKVIEDKIAKLQYRLFQLDHEIPDEVVKLGNPGAREYLMINKWGWEQEPHRLIVRGVYTTPDGKNLSMGYLVSNHELFNLTDRIALFEHLHRQVLSQLAAELEKRIE